MVEKRKNKVLSHSQFYELCEALKAHQDELVKIGNREVVLAKLEEYVGFPIGKEPFFRAAEVTKIKFRFGTNAKNQQNVAHNNLRKLATAFVQLCNQIGEKVPDGAADVYNYYRKIEGVTPEQQAQHPMPLPPVPPGKQPPVPPGGLSTRNITVANQIDNNRR